MKTKSKLKHHKQFHKLSSDFKLKWFGNGEWVEEPDFCCFIYKKYRCFITRVCIPDGPNHVFGGHFCGYIKLIKTNKYYNLSKDEIRDAFQFHWGVSFDEINRRGYRIIGFDCAHSNDIVPSMIKMNNQIKKDLSEKFPNLSKYSDSLFKPYYKNIKFVENSIIDCIDNLK